MTAPWLGEMTAEERVAALFDYEPSEDEDGIRLAGHAHPDDAAAMVCDAELRARRKALDEAAKVAENYDCGPWGAESARDAEEITASRIARTIRCLS